MGRTNVQARADDRERDAPSVAPGEDLVDQADQRVAVFTGPLQQRRGSVQEFAGADLGERFEHRLEIPDYAAELEFEKDATINLTDTIREDTLLALPSYPRCEGGNVRPRQCPAEGRFEPVLETAEEEPQSAGPGVWEALNKLN